MNIALSHFHLFLYFSSLMYEGLSVLITGHFVIRRNIRVIKNKIQLYDALGQFSIVVSFPVFWS